MRKWHRWFAWFPVTVDERRVWLRFVERVWFVPPTEGAPKRVARYRLIA